MTGTRLSRVEFIRRAGLVGFSLSAGATLLAGCGGDDDGGEPAAGGTTGATTTEVEQLAGTIKMINYPNWMGKTEVKRFEELYPEVSVREISLQTGTAAGTVLAVRQNPDAYDMLLADQSLVEQLDQGGLLAELDFSRIPNIEFVDQKFRSDFPRGIPTDYGKIGFGYRTDLVDGKPTTWADFWELAPQHSGKVTLLNNERDVFGAALKYLGYSGNTTDESELEEAKNAVIEIKPDLLAFVGIDVGKNLVKGAAVMAQSFDFDIAFAQADEPKVAWVAPEDGLMGYVEGWVAVKDTEVLNEIHAFMDFHLDPETYAEFINTTGAAFVEPDAAQYIDKSIVDSPITAFDEEVVARVEFYSFLGDAAGLWARAWDEVQAA
jgi:spermidine/putrescine transport system substrate-binding protein